jgi:transposase InsO family protein
MSFNYEDRIKILEHAKRHGVQSVIDTLAFSDRTINRSTISRWRKAQLAVGQSQGLVTEYMSLQPKSTKPRSYKTSEYASVLYEFVKVYRKKRYKVGKVKLATIIKSACTCLEYAQSIRAEYGKTFMLYGLKPISPSTVGRILKELKKTRSIPRSAKEYNAQKEVYLHGGTGQIKIRKVVDRNKLYGQPKNRKPKDYKPEKVGELIQLDAVTVQTTIPDKETGILKKKNLYFICGIDLVSRIAFCHQYEHLNSTATTDFIQRFESQLTQLTRQNITDQNQKEKHQIKIKKVQTDNGQENHKHFINHLDKQGIEHFWNYPRSPKSNAYIEKFNHTIQAECIEWNLHYLRHNQQTQFTQNLTNFLSFYNHQRPHTSLQYLSPLQYFNQQLQQT